MRLGLSAKSLLFLCCLMFASHGWAHEESLSLDGEQKEVIKPSPYQDQEDSEVMFVTQGGKRLKMLGSFEERESSYRQQLTEFAKQKNQKLNGDLSDQTLDVLIAMVHEKQEKVGTSTLIHIWGQAALLRTLATLPTEDSNASQEELVEPNIGKGLVGGLIGSAKDPKNKNLIKKLKELQKEICTVLDLSDVYWNYRDKP